MSDPRHAMIYCDAIDNNWWLEIYPYDTVRPVHTRSESAYTYGPFKSPENAEKFAGDNFANAGFEIPVLSILEWMSPPSRTLKLSINRRKSKISVFTSPREMFLR
jgi:hypothetical protein